MNSGTLLGSVLPYIINLLGLKDIINLSMTSRSLYNTTIEYRFRWKQIYSDSINLMFINAIDNNYLREAKMILFQNYEQINIDYLINNCNNYPIISELFAPMEMLLKGDCNSCYNLTQIIDLIVKRGGTRYDLEIMLEKYKQYFLVNDDIIVGFILSSIIYNRLDLFDLLIKYCELDKIDRYLDLCYLYPNCNKDQLLTLMKREPKILDQKQIIELGSELVNKLNIKIDSDDFSSHFNSGIAISVKLNLI